MPKSFYVRIMNKIDDSNYFLWFSTYFLAKLTCFKALSFLESINIFEASTLNCWLFVSDFLSFKTTPDVAHSFLEK